MRLQAMFERFALLLLWLTALFTMLAVGLVAWLVL
jgi:hypothetical protein